MFYYFFVVDHRLVVIGIHLKLIWNLQRTMTITPAVANQAEEVTVGAPGSNQQEVLVSRQQDSQQFINMLQNGNFVFMKYFYHCMCFPYL